MLKRLGFVDVEKGWNWVKSWENELEMEKWNGKVNSSGRKSLWFGVGVDLGFEKKVFKGKDISEGLRMRGNELYGSSDWNSLLLYKYEKGVELKDHKDRKWFDKKVVIVNFCKNLVGFKYGGEIYGVRDGEVIEIDSRVIHGVLGVDNERWSLSFRKVI